RNTTHHQPHEAAKQSAADALNAMLDEAPITWSGNHMRVKHDPARLRLWKKHQCELLRDIFGNPFQNPTLEAGWITSASRNIAEGIYRDGAFERLPLLADALEEGGCTEAEVLTHCRGPGPHVRGCWVVDLLHTRTGNC